MKKISIILVKMRVKSSDSVSSFLAFAKVGDNYAPFIWLQLLSTSLNIYNIYNTVIPLLNLPDHGRLIEISPLLVFGPNFTPN